jgi:hypothetical protein
METVFGYVTAVARVNAHVGYIKVAESISKSEKLHPMPASGSDSENPHHLFVPVMTRGSLLHSAA